MKKVHPLPKLHSFQVTFLVDNTVDKDIPKQEVRGSKLSVKLEEKYLKKVLGKAVR